MQDSLASLVSEAGDADIRLEKLLRHYKQTDQKTKRILEINARHPLIRDLSIYLEKTGQADDLQDMAWIIYEQARLSEGEQLLNPKEYHQRLQKFLRRSLNQG